MRRTSHTGLALLVIVRVISQCSLKMVRGMSMSTTPVPLRPPRQPGSLQGARAQTCRWCLDAESRRLDNEQDKRTCTDPRHLELKQLVLQGVVDRENTGWSGSAVSTCERDKHAGSLVDELGHGHALELCAFSTPCTRSSPHIHRSSRARTGQPAFLCRLQLRSIPAHVNAGRGAPSHNTQDVPEGSTRYSSGPSCLSKPATTQLTPTGR